jgi:hypothetical protein
MTTTTPAAVTARLQNMPMADLIGYFVSTSAGKPTMSQVIARGWIMDELERRNPEAFAAWLDSDIPEDSALYEYFC